MSYSTKSLYCYTIPDVELHSVFRISYLQYLMLYYFGIDFFCCNVQSFSNRIAHIMFKLSYTQDDK